VAGVLPGDLDPAGGAYSTSPDSLADWRFIVLFAEVVQVNACVQKVVLSTKSNNLTYTVFV